MIQRNLINDQWKSNNQDMTDIYEHKASKPTYKQIPLIQEKAPADNDGTRKQAGEFECPRVKDQEQPCKGHKQNKADQHNMKRSAVEGVPRLYNTGVGIGDKASWQPVSASNKGKQQCKCQRVYNPIESADKKSRPVRQDRRGKSKNNLKGLPIGEKV